MHRALLARTKLLPGRGRTLEPSSRSGPLERRWPPWPPVAVRRRLPTLSLQGSGSNPNPFEGCSTLPGQVDRLPTQRLTCTVRTPDSLPPTDRFPMPPPSPLRFPAQLGTTGSHLGRASESSSLVLVSPFSSHRSHARKAPCVAAKSRLQPPPQPQCDGGREAAAAFALAQARDPPPLSSPSLRGHGAPPDG